MFVMSYSTVCMHAISFDADPSADLGGAVCSGQQAHANVWMLHAAVAKLLLICETVSGQFQAPCDLHQVKYAHFMKKHG